MELHHGGRGNGRRPAAADGPAQRGQVRGIRRRAPGAHCRRGPCLRHAMLRVHNLERKHVTGTLDLTVTIQVAPRLPSCHSVWCAGSVCFPFPHRQRPSQGHGSITVASAHRSCHDDLQSVHRLAGHDRGPGHPADAHDGPAAGAASPHGASAAARRVSPAESVSLGTEAPACADLMQGRATADLPHTAPVMRARSLPAAPPLVAADR